MFLAFLPRPTKVLKVTSPVTTGYNLRTEAGSPTYPLNVITLIQTTVTSDKANTAAVEVGTGWTAGTFLYIKNTSTVTGRKGITGTTGTTGTAGATGSTGTSGAGGTGGNGGSSGAGTATTDTTEDSQLNQLEKEAYLKGNISLRNFLDDLK